MAERAILIEGGCSPPGPFVRESPSPSGEGPVLGSMIHLRRSRASARAEIADKPGGHAGGQAAFRVEQAWAMALCARHGLGSGVEVAWPVVAAQGVVMAGRAVRQDGSRNFDRLVV